MAVAFGIRRKEVSSHINFNYYCLHSGLVIYKTGISARIRTSKLYHANNQPGILRDIFNLIYLL